MSQFTNLQKKHTILLIINSQWTLRRAPTIVFCESKFTKERNTYFLISTIFVRTKLIFIPPMRKLLLLCSLFFCKLQIIRYSTILLSGKKHRIFFITTYIPDYGKSKSNLMLASFGFFGHRSWIQLLTLTAGFHSSVVTTRNFKKLQYKRFKAIENLK